jgi:hypothetical protein
MPLDPSQFFGYDQVEEVKRPHPGFFDQAKNQIPALTPEGILAAKLRDNAPASARPGSLPIAGRPSVQSLYDQLGTLNNEPLDFSKLTEINKANQEASNTNFAQALALQMFGGKTAQAPGRAMMEEAISQSKPIRPNAADIGWSNPETGEFVRNPVMERQQKEKVVMSRIDALVKEKEHEAALLVQQGKLAEAETAHRNAEQLKLLTMGILSGNQQILGALTAARIDALEAKATGAGKGAGKPLSNPERKDLMELGTHYQNLDDLTKGFKEAYSPQGYGGKPVVQLQNAVTAAFPKARNLFTNKADQARMDEQANWWKQMELFDTLPERHAKFGATLTAGERAAWNSASIQPGMQPKEIKKFLNTRLEVMREVARRERETHIENNKHPGAVNAALKPFKFDDNPGDLDAELARRGAK